MNFDWFKFFRSKPEPEPVEQARNSSASITAMIDVAVEKAQKETGACTDEVQVKSRRAVNASRRVIANTGQYKAIEQILADDVEKSS